MLCISLFYRNAWKINDYKVYKLFSNNFWITIKFVPQIIIINKPRKCFFQK